MDVASGCTERILELRPCGYHAGYTRNVTSGNCSMERGMFRAVRLLDKRSNPRNAIFIDPADFKDYIIRCRYMRDITVKVTSDVTPKDVDMTIITPMASSGRLGGKWATSDAPLPSWGGCVSVLLLNINYTENRLAYCHL